MINPVSLFVNIPSKLPIVKTGAGGSAMILQYICDTPYELKYNENTKSITFHSFIGRIQSILLIGLLWFYDEEKEPGLFNKKYGIKVIIDYPDLEKSFVISYEEFPQEAYDRVNDSQILVEIVLGCHKHPDGGNLSYWGSLEKGIFPNHDNRKKFTIKSDKIHELLTMDYHTMGLSAVYEPNLTRVLNIFESTYI